jgi:hypothetical protein
MRLAASFATSSVEFPAEWGALCEQAAGAAKGKRAYKDLALRTYLRAVTIDPRQSAAWKRVRALEAELKGAQ